MKIYLLWILLFPVLSFAQMPFYYKIKDVSGTLIQSDSSTLTVKFISRRKLEINNCKDPALDTMLRTLTFSRRSRKYLEHLITTSAKITINVSNRVGIMQKNGKYRLIAGLTGPVNNPEKLTITEQASNFSPRNKYFPSQIFPENKIEIYKGSLFYYFDTTRVLNTDNTALYDSTGAAIHVFSMDTIHIEPIMYPDLMYRNLKELYYFAGVHEIVHTTPVNIGDQISSYDAEKWAFAVERKLFKRRKMVNRKSVR